jgi:protein-L-isoaspartate(D-aspartate) O-methyltransferase
MSTTTTQSNARLQPHRDFFASYILAKADVVNPRLFNAFLSTPREAFVGPGPWVIYVRPGRYLRTPTTDPIFLYQDLLVALDAQRGIHNGEPSLHARCIDALAVAEGEGVIHIGAGTGYYTAILARMVGPGGHVDAYEMDTDLAGKAAANLSVFGRVRLHAESGTARPLPPADAIYVSAGATHPDRNWLAALRPGGRLLFPLTPNAGTGGMLLIQRQKAGFAARVVCTAGFIPCEGARDQDTGAKLAAVFASGGWGQVKALYLDIAPDTRWLSTDELAD